METLFTLVLIAKFQSSLTASLFMWCVTVIPETGRNYKTENKQGCNFLIYFIGFSDTGSKELTVGT
jgi:hypothetical protein